MLELVSVKKGAWLCHMLYPTRSCLGHSSQRVGHCPVHHPCQYLQYCLGLGGSSWVISIRYVLQSDMGLQVHLTFLVRHVLQKSSRSGMWGGMSSSMSLTINVLGGYSHPLTTINKSNLNQLSLGAHLVSHGRVVSSWNGSCSVWPSSRACTFLLLCVSLYGGWIFPIWFYSLVPPPWCP